MVVEVPLIPEHPIARGKKLRRDLLRRRLAGATGHRRDACAGSAANVARDFLQRPRRILHLHHQHARSDGQADGGCVMHEYAGGTLGQRVVDERVTIETLAADGDEEIPRRQRPAVDRYAPNRGIGRAVYQATPGRGNDVSGGQWQWFHPVNTPGSASDVARAPHVRPRHRRTAARVPR